MSTRRPFPPLSSLAGSPSPCVKTGKQLITPQHPETTIDEPTNQTTISIVSSSQLLREGLAALLSAYSKLCVVGKYSEHIPGAIPLPNPAGHVVLLDGGLGRNLAIPWTLYWRKLDMPAHVVVLELLNDIDLILAYIEAGAEGYTLLGASIDEVVETIDRVRCGVAQCSPEVTARLFARLAVLRSATPMLVVDSAELTPREVEVLRYIAEDYSNQEIANVLVIEVRTVKHHVHNILEKLNMRSRSDAARFAAAQGWLEPDLANALGQEEFAIGIDHVHDTVSAHLGTVTW